MATSGWRAFRLLFGLLLLLTSVWPVFYLRLPGGPAAPGAPAARRNLTVLVWRWPFGRSYRLGADRCLARYNTAGCLLTDRPAALGEADVVVFHHWELGGGRSLLPLHRPRPPSQRWVWLSLEPPAHNANLSHLNGLFNWTMSYRRDADVFVPYGRTVRGGGRPLPRPASNRSCLVSWVVSSYRPGQARAAVYQRLKRLLPIQVFGRWNKKPLSKRELLPTIARCLFYLSFENAQAQDYISEKLWRNAFQAGAVPVVLGPSRATYQALAPPHSFIHVSDFQSLEALAAYLKQLAADRKSYEEYFLWRRTHSVQTFSDWRDRFCQICVQHPHLPPHKVYWDLERWVQGPDSH